MNSAVKFHNIAYNFGKIRDSPFPLCVVTSAGGY